jgi:predicted permease
MSAFTRARELLRALLFHRRAESELAEELRFHLDMEVAANERRGLDAAEARRRALATFGGVERFKEEVRDARGSGHLERLVLDVRYALRGLLRSPGFTLAAMAALALGVGANTAVFSVIDGIVLKPIPYPDAERVVYLGWENGKGGRMPALSPLMFVFFREQSRSFEGVATTRQWTAELDGDPAQPLVHGVRVSTDFFDVVGVRPALGRALAPDENEPGGPKTVVLSHRFWADRLGGDPAVLGKSLRLGDDSYTIVGVMPDDFRMVGNSASSNDVLVPLQLRVDPSDIGLNYEVIARLRSGVTERQLLADLARVSSAFHAQHPGDDEALDGSVYATTYRDVYTGGFAHTLWILLGATLFVLLIACADVANLLLARSAGRQREFATRVALGAGRARIVRQLLTESLALGILGGAAGLLLGVGILRLLLASMPWSLPRAGEMGLDTRVLGFTLLISLGTAVVFGLVSALGATRPDVAASLREGGRAGESTARRRARESLMAIEAGVSLVLVVGAGLLIASFIRLYRIDPGFDAKNVVTARFDHAPAGYDASGALWRFEQEVLAQLHRLPEVESAAGTSITPLAGQWNLPVTVEGRPDATEGAVQWRAISPEYFRTMRIPLSRGRPFATADGAGAPDVAIITQSMAERYWPGGDAIGKRILLGVYKGKVRAGESARPREVIGIVGDARDIALDRAPARTVYIPQAQVPDDWGVSLPTFVIRGRGDSHPSREEIVRVMHDADPRLRPPMIEPLTNLMAASVASERFTMLLMSLFAGLALVLTAIGIYGVISYAVGRRRQEIGVRMALGARASDVSRLMVRQAMRPVLLGLVAGVAAALLLTRLLAGMVYGVSVRDPLTFVLVLCVLAAVAALAAYLPSRSATRIDPSLALRAE